MSEPDPELEIEEFEDTLVDGDVPYTRGTAQAALRNRNFRILYFGTFASNIGTWMQNALIGAFAYKLTNNGAFVGLLFFCQLGPLLFLSLWGGLLADTVDRRRLLISAQVAQGALSFALAGVAFAAHPAWPLFTVLVFAIGIANALGAPGLSAILPTLVPRADLGGAVSLTSVQMNLSRVIGPVIGAIIFAEVGAGWVFGINAFTYVFAVLGLVWARYPRRADARIDEQGLRRLLSGLRIARRDPFLVQLLLTLFTFSLFSVTWVGLMPQIAKNSLGIDPQSWQYGLFYGFLGIGATLGAISVGTIAARRDKVTMLRPGFLAYAVLLAVFSLVSSEVAGDLSVVVLAYAYFFVVTCLSTALQQHLDDRERGRIMALWIMSFGGTVPIGVLLAGPFSDHHVRAVMLLGAVWAVVLAVWSNAKRLNRKAGLRHV